MLSLAAIVAWPLSKTLHLSNIFLAQKKTLIMAVAFCNKKKSGAELQLLIRILEKKKKVLCTNISQESGVSPSRV